MNSIYNIEFIPYYPEVAKKFWLSEKENLLFWFIKFYGSINPINFTSEELSSLIGINPRTIDNIVSKLKKIGLIKTETTRVSTDTWFISHRVMSALTDTWVHSQPRDIYTSQPRDINIYNNINNNILYYIKLIKEKNININNLDNNNLNNINNNIKLLGELFFSLSAENKKTNFAEVPLNKVIEFWNSIPVPHWKKFTAKEWTNSYNLLLKIYREVQSIYSKEEFFTAVDNYREEISRRTPSTNLGDYYFHRFGLFEFLKQKNWLQKFLLYS